DVVAAVTHVDLVGGVHGAAEAPGGQRRHNLVRIHVAARAGAGLEDVDRELRVVVAGRDLRRGRLHRLRDALIEQPQTPVRTRRGLLHQPERGDDGSRPGEAAYGEGR